MCQCSPAAFRGVSSSALLLFSGVLALLAPHPVALAAEVALDLTQYAHTAWTDSEGLKGQINSIAQTPDGYLWLATEFGLVRFDGVRFVPSGARAGTPVPSRDVLCVLAAHTGTLWVGTLDGLARWDKGQLTQYPEFKGQPVLALLEDHEGTVWAGGPRGLCAIREKKVECSVIEGPPGKELYYSYGNRSSSVFSLYEDGDRHLWAGTDSGLWLWKPGPPNRYESQPIRVQQGLARGPEGAGLIAITGWNDRVLRQTASQGMREYTIPGIRQPFDAQRLLRDRHGALWIATVHQGLLHVQNEKISRFSQDNGLSNDHIRALFEDHEGTIWVGTANGLDRFREGAVSSISSKQGLSPPVVSVLAARDGAVWFGSYGGLSKWSEGQVTIYRATAAPITPSAAPQKRETSGARDLVTEVTNTGLPQNEIDSLFEDPLGRIWLTTHDGAGWFEHGRFTRAAGVPAGSAIAIFADAREGVWISYPTSGLFHVINGSVAESVPWPWSLVGNGPRLSAVVPDRIGGGLWAGFLERGIGYLKDGQVRTTLGLKDGLGSDTVWNLYLDHESTLWAATAGGLSRLKAGRVATLTTKNGLPCDAVYWVIEDDAFSLWLYTACGLLRVDRAELSAWVSDSKRSVHPIVFDRSDGIKMHAPANGFSPAVTKSPDGKLWFVQSDGVSVIDPLRLRINRIPPPVYIEQIAADGQTYSVTSGLHLPAQVRDLSINYTALSLAAPEKVHFRFKLEGQDPAWREVVNIRRVQYSNLAPGNYRFRVVATNNSGVWNEQGAALDFSIAPAYWQTIWFRAACLAVFLLVMWALYQLRMRQIAQAFNTRLEERVAERTRIARDLHDTLLQGFQGLLLRFQTVYELLPQRPTDAKETLASAIDRTAQAITDGRNAVQGLRASTVESNDLAAAITSLGEELAAEAGPHASIGLRVEVEGMPQTLRAIVRDEIYRIAGEALRNAFRHADANEIEVELRYDERQLRLRVRDDGKGIDPQFLGTEGRAGHFGLHGMRERAELMGGKLTVWSAPDSGTEIELSIPAARAYAEPTGTRRWWLSEKFAPKSTQSEP